MPWIRSIRIKRTLPRVTYITERRSSDVLYVYRIPVRTYSSLYLLLRIIPTSLLRTEVLATSVLDYYLYLRGQLKLEHYKSA